MLQNVSVEFIYVTTKSNIFSLTKTNINVINFRDSWDETEQTFSLIHFYHNLPFS